VAACEFKARGGLIRHCCLLWSGRGGFRLPARRRSKFLWPSLSGPCEHLFLMY